MRTSLLKHRHLMLSLPAGESGGGSSTPPAPGAPAADQAQGAPAAPQPPPAGPPAPPAPVDAPSGDTLPDDPAALQRMVRDLRRENASARTSTRDQAAEQARTELAQQIGRALGLVPDDTPVDPAQLTAQAAAAQRQARDAQVELAVYRAAGNHQGDPNALLDSRAFLAKVADLDPTAATFAADVDAAIREAVTSNPKLKTVQAAGASGAEFTGGSGEQRTSTPKDLTSAISQHYGQ